MGTNSTLRAYNFHFLPTTATKRFIYPFPLFTDIMARFETSGNSALDKEVTIRIRPRSILKATIFTVLLLLTFFLGRWSVDSSSLENATIASAVVADVAEAEEPAPVEAEVADDSSSFSLTGFFKGLFTSSDIEDEITNAVVAETNTVNTTVEETPVVNTTTEENTTVEEPIITTYTKVAVAINDVDFDWKETWGKITKVDYTIKNTETGTIKPDHLGMLVEGYDDFEKKIPLPLSSKTIKAGESASSKVQVPMGFSYSPVTAGDLTTVEITFTLYDADNKVMTSFKTAYNLNG